MSADIYFTKDTLDLPNGWINSEFVWTESYSQKLEAYSVYYKTFSNILTVRTISVEYLVAMKLMSGRFYKNDLSDIAGILLEHEERGMPMPLEQISAAVENLYDGWEMLPDGSLPLMESMLESDDYEKLYKTYREKEKDNADSLIQFEENYPGIIKECNVDQILKNLNELKEKNQESGRIKPYPCKR